MNEYQQAITRIIELEDQATAARIKLKLAQGLSTDIGRQLGDTFALLGESRDLMTIGALESPLRKEMMSLIERIDEFYPKGE